MRLSHTSLIGLSALIAVSALSLPGCSSDPDPDSSTGGDGDGDAGETPLPAEAPADQARIRRLTHEEWSQSVLDLFRTEEDSPLGLELTELGERLPGLAGRGEFLFDGKADLLEVDGPLAIGYAQSAKRIAERVVFDEAALAAILPTKEGTNTKKAREFIRLFGVRVFRRLLSEEEVDEYFELFGEGLETYYDDPEDPDYLLNLSDSDVEEFSFLGGIRLLIEAFLQSPHFIYRVELSEEDAVEDGYPLDSFERATRLSYFFWGTTPDDDLIEAAYNGDLDTEAGARTVARRLASDERAKARVFSFFSQVFEIEGYEGKIRPNADVFPDVPDNLGELAFQEAKAFIDIEMFDNDGSIDDLFSSTNAYVNEDLAAIYGVDDVDGSGFFKVELDEDKRRGFFSRVGFLASQSTSVHPDPIHRGVFLSKRINCLPLLAPPDDIPELGTPSGQTNRELVEDLTEEPGTICRGCHQTTINPFGFLFESYDAVGAYRTKDGEFDVDTAASPLINGEPTPMEHAGELSTAMAESIDVHECLASHLISFAHGREMEDGDRRLALRLGTTSLEDESSFVDLMVELAVSKSFLYRPAESEE